MQTFIYWHAATKTGVTDVGNDDDDVADDDADYDDQISKLKTRCCLKLTK